MTDKFACVMPGALVRRSRHWHSSRSGDTRGQLGIVVDLKIFKESGNLITYPVIHWQGQHSSSLTHPDNADLAFNRFKPRVK